MGEKEKAKVYATRKNQIKTKWGVACVVPLRIINDVDRDCLIKYFHYPFFPLKPLRKLMLGAEVKSLDREI